MPEARRRRRKITAEDLYRFQTITDLELSPDGKQVVFAIRRIDRQSEKKFANLRMIDAASGEVRAFTQGDHTDSLPRWSPDGRQIAFLSNRADENQPQIYLIPTDGGEARQLTDLKGEFGSLEWSPDGRWIACQFRKKDAEDIEREQDESKKKLGVVVRPIERIFYKLDGHGFLPRERWHVWLINARTGKARQITDSPVFDDLEPVWSPDGKRLAYTSNRAPDPDLDYDQIDVFEFDLETGQERLIPTPPGPKGKLSYSPDGRLIAYIGHEGKTLDWKNDSLWIVTADGSKAAINLTGKYDFHVNDWTIADISGHKLMPPTWSNDGQRLYFQVLHHGITRLDSIDVKTGELAPLLRDPGVVMEHNFDRAQRRLAYFFATMTDPGQIYLYEMETGQSRALTSLNRDWLDGVDLGEVEEMWFKGASGNDLQGWILKPPDFDAARKYPSVLEIHGGPLLQYGHNFMHEFYFLAANGYVVYFCNPRGGQGYGEEHARAIHGAWGTVDYDDLMAWTDFVAQKPYIDAERMGVAGGSYGGYMTNWIISHTHRFHAAVTQRSVSNIVSMWGSSDFNWAFQDTFLGKAPYEDGQILWDRSPIKYFANVRTPTLVSHSEQDLRCPLEQDEQVYVALRKLGVPTRFIIFPEESHDLSRSGRTDRRIVRLKEFLAWFDRWLKGDS